MGVYRELQCRSLTSGLNKIHCKKHLRSLQSQLEIKWNLLNQTMPPDYHQAKRPEEEEASAAVPRLLPSHKVGKKPLLEIRGVRGHSTQWLISSMLQSPNRIQDFKKADAVAAHLWKLLRGWYYLKMYMCAQSLQLCPTPCDPMDWSCQAPLSMEFSRQEYWSVLPFTSPGNLPNLGIKPASLASPARVWIFFFFKLLAPPGKPPIYLILLNNLFIYLFNFGHTAQHGWS